MRKTNILISLFFLLCLTATSFAQQKKNVLLFLVDDLGWADVGTYGSSFYETPNIDKLAKQGMKFTNAYAACPVCSPTRASIMTGKYPVAMQTTDWFGAVQPQEAKQ
ncbi:MAG: sulfatase-like hydrolase/transferase, partial [Segetibacter sp.]